MSESECPQCKKTLKSSATRLVQDSCGHKKCRLCLLEDEIGCLQCSLDAKSKADNVLNLIKSKEDSVIRYENNQTTVITCNKFCLPSKILNENVFLANKNESEEFLKPTDEDNKIKDCKETADFDVPSNKRRYTFFVMPSHISVVKGDQENGEKYKCNICQKVFQTKYYMKAHAYCAEGCSKPFKCEKCDKCFISKSLMESHSLTHLNVMPYTCEVCKKSFKQKSKLKRHKVTHTDSALFVCQKCGKTFKSKDYLKVHSFIHEKEKPFSCKICNSKFSNFSNMKKHLAKHSKDKNHMCEQCGKRFKLKWSLTVHRRSHIRLRLHKCSDCSKAFINAKELRRHLLTHLDVKAYACGLCKTEFRRRDNLERHVKTAHPGKKGAIVKNNIEELIRKKLNAGNGQRAEAIKEKPNAIKVITSQPLPSSFNKQGSICSPVINAPLKLAFKTKAFKNHYNIHSREYVEPPPKLQLRPSYDPAESVNICKKILSPYSPPPAPVKPVTTSVSEMQSNEICQKILNSTPIDNDQLKQHAYRSIKFKLPSNYKNLFKNDHIQPLKPVQDVRLHIPSTSTGAGTCREPSSALPPVNCATSVIVNSPYTNKM